MLRLIGYSLGICLCANGQFFGLATPADGSRVYFTTTLRQKDTTQPNYGKLFQVDASGLQLVLSRNVVPPPTPTSNQGALTNAYDLNAASVSADGSVFAIAATRACVGADTVCTRAEYFSTTVTAAGQDRDFPGRLQVSANGAWAFGPGSNPYYGGKAAYLFNLATGEEVALGNVPSLYGVQIASTGRAVADDGTVVYTTEREILTVHAGEMRRIAPPNLYFDAGDAVLDRGGRTIVFSGCGVDSLLASCTESIRLADATGPGSSLLVSDGYAPSLSDDGRTLLYLSNRTNPHLRIFRFDGFSDRPLASDPAGIAQAILSGDGSTVYAVTLGARLLKISLATGAVQELIPRTPYLTLNGPSPAPGKLTSLPGVGLTDLSFSAGPPLPQSLNGVGVTIQGLQARIQSVTPNAITVLVPPTVVPGSGTSALDVTVTSASPFDGPHADVYIAQYAPEFVQVAGVNVLLAAHHDWSALVSAGNPAHPGEVIHAYAVGLGNTLPAVAYGEAAPAQEPFARMTIPLGCANGNDTKAAVEIPFQGLAPNLAGFYQIDLRVPAPLPDLPTSYFPLYCVWGGPASGGPGLGQMYGAIPVGTVTGPPARRDLAVTRRVR
jgi:uncharacterized protein (TIGR03437 family)